MKKILISIYKNSLIFSYNTQKVNEKKLLNTNVIDNNQLLFSDEYLLNNTKIVSLFLKELVKEKKIKQITVITNDLALIALNLTKNIASIEILYLKEDVSLPYEICEKITKNKYIRYLNCYNVPTFMLDLLDKYGVIVKSRIELFFTSDFMQGNQLTEFSNIYYKLSIRIRFPLSKEDCEDLETFLKINRYLQTIHINKVNKKDIDYLIKVLKENKITNIKILIHNNITNEKTIEYLKKMNKKYKRRYKISFSLVYSSEYLQKNVFNQLLINILRICGLIILVLVVFVTGYIFISNYFSMKEVTAIQENINETIEKKKETQKEEQPNTNVENPNNPSSDEPVITNAYIASLLSINPNTVGWLKVNNTNVDYSVVQATDNDYYLSHNFNDQEDRNGWVFMDYRNERADLDKNTILYGHNRYYSGIMFGTLYKTAYKSWYNNKENLTIKFDTLYDSMEWQIFSIYKVQKTSDYLKVSFNSDSEWLDFIKMLKDRSITNFGVDVGVNDKILTLSTCSNNNKRFVIHAVLKK